MLLFLLNLGIELESAQFIIKDFSYIFGVAMGFSCMNLTWRIVAMP